MGYRDGSTPAPGYGDRGGDKLTYAGRRRQPCSRTATAELLETPAAITPRPAITLVRYHGVLAPPARGRSQVVRDGRAAPDATACSLAASQSPRRRYPGPVDLGRADAPRVRS